MFSGGVGVCVGGGGVGRGRGGGGVRGGGWVTYFPFHTKLIFWVPFATATRLNNVESTGAGMRASSSLFSGTENKISGSGAGVAAEEDAPRAAPPAGVGRGRMQRRNTVVGVGFGGSRGAFGSAAQHRNAVFAIGSSASLGGGFQQLTGALSSSEKRTSSPRAASIELSRALSTRRKSLSVPQLAKENDARSVRPLMMPGSPPAARGGTTTTSFATADGALLPATTTASETKNLSRRATVVLPSPFRSLRRVVASIDDARQNASENHHGGGRRNSTGDSTRGASSSADKLSSQRDRVDSGGGGGGSKAARSGFARTDSCLLGSFRSELAKAGFKPETSQDDVFAGLIKPLPARGETVSGGASASGQQQQGPASGKKLMRSGTLPASTRRSMETGAKSDSRERATAQKLRIDPVPPQGPCGGTASMRSLQGNMINDPTEATTTTTQPTLLTTSPDHPVVTTSTKKAPTDVSPLPKKDPPVFATASTGLRALLEELGQNDDPATSSITLPPLRSVAATSGASSGDRAGSPGSTGGAKSLRRKRSDLQEEAEHDERREGGNPGADAGVPPVGEEMTVARDHEDSAGVAPATKWTSSADPSVTSNAALGPHFSTAVARSRQNSVDDFQVQQKSGAIISKLSEKIFSERSSPDGGGPLNDSLESDTTVPQQNLPSSAPQQNLTSTPAPSSPSRKPDKNRPNSPLRHATRTPSAQQEMAPKQNKSIFDTIPESTSKVLLKADVKHCLRDLGRR